MSEEQYGFAIVGCGVIGKSHAEGLRKVENAKLVAVCDEQPERAQAFAEQFGCAAYSDVNEMLKRADINIVNICTPSGMHGDFTVAAARAGKHVITEKPIDITLERADRMIEECRKAGVKLAVISQHRLQPSTVQVKQDLEKGRFGKLIMGTGAINWYRSQAYYDSGAWRGTWELDGGGALMNQGIHTIDVLQYLMGPIESVFAHCETLGHDRIEVEDAAVAVLRFRNGAIGTLVGTTCAYPGLSTRIEIFGKDGSAVIDADQLVLNKFRDDGGEVGVYGSGPSSASADDAGPATAVQESGHVKQFKDMIAAIEERREPVINGEEARKPLEVILAVYESARTGRPVILPLK